MDEFILLFSALNEVRLNDDRHHLMEMDEIRRLRGSLSGLRCTILGGLPCIQSVDNMEGFHRTHVLFFRLAGFTREGAHG
jgi:hypothetical protein